MITNIKNKMLSVPPAQKLKKKKRKKKDEKDQTHTGHVCIGGQLRLS